ncbi:MAG: 2,4-dihydroxyhept-2-ene-1,7-dioic acid aldolase [Rubrivivax sp.]|nr:2,4-dihydroxyhept-2-ene-1,7-dioic acid aldolase [Rubrivivax sp.]
MRPNRVRQLFAQGQTVIAGWLSLDSAYAAELVGSAGFDAVVIDTQHGMAGHAQMVAMLQALSHTPATPLVRVSQNNLAEVNRALDAGAYGVICPLVNSAAEAAAFARACRYPLDGVAGERSFGPARGLLYGGADYAQQANHTVLALPMVETRAGLEALDAIVACDGVDGIFIGPSDLGLALGLGPGALHTEPLRAQALARAAAACRAAGKLAGVWCASAEMARDMTAAGYGLVVPGHDAIWLKAEITRRLAVIRPGPSR